MSSRLVASGPSLQINSISNLHPSNYSEVEAEVKYLTQSKNAVKKMITPSKSSDPAILASISLVPNHDKQIKMTTDDINYKIEVLENRIEH